MTEEINDKSNEELTLGFQPEAASSKTTTELLAERDKLLAQRAQIDNSLTEINEHIESHLEEKLVEAISALVPQGIGVDALFYIDEKNPDRLAITLSLALNQVADFDIKQFFLKLQSALQGSAKVDKAYEAESIRLITSVSTVNDLLAKIKALPIQENSASAQINDILGNDL